MILYFLLIIFMTLFGSVASFFFKKASTTRNIFQLAINIDFYVGCFLYLLAAILNIIVLRFLDYSLVLPLTALTYVWTMIISNKFLNEEITNKKKFGVFLIFVGSLLISITK